MKTIKVLAVEDPALFAFNDNSLQILKEFNTPVSFEQYTWSLYIEKLNNSLYKNEDYDIVMLPGHLFLKDLILKKLLHKLDHVKSNYHESFFYDMKVNEDFYAIPSFYDGHIVVYRKGFDDELDNESSNLISCDKFIEIAKRSFFRKFSLKADKSEIFTDALPFLRFFDKNNNLVDIYDDKGNVQNLLIFEKNLNKYCDLKNSAIPNTEHFGNHEVAQSFIKGHTNLMITWSGQLGLINQDLNFNKKEYGFKTLDTAWSVAWCFSILEKSQNKDKAKEFLSYLQDINIDKKCFKYSGTTLFKDNDINYAWKDANNTLLNTYKPLAFNSHGTSINGLLYEYIYKAYTKELSAYDALQEANYKIQQLMR